MNYHMSMLQMNQNIKSIVNNVNAMNQMVNSNKAMLQSSTNNNNNSNIYNNNNNANCNAYYQPSQYYQQQQQQQTPRHHNHTQHANVHSNKQFYPQSYTTCK